MKKFDLFLFLISFFLSFHALLKNLSRFYLKNTPLTESFEIGPVLFASDFRILNEGKKVKPHVNFLRKHQLPRHSSVTVALI